jgi:hypothetical protein
LKIWRSDWPSASSAFFLHNLSILRQLSVGTRELTEANADRWAFAREGLITDPKSGHKYDVLAVFRLIGEPLVAVHEHVLKEPVQSRLRQFVRAALTGQNFG